MMNDQEQDQLESYFDGLLEGQEVEAVKQRVECDANWRAAHEALEITRSMVRTFVKEQVEQVDLDGLWERVASELPEDLGRHAAAELTQSPAREPRTLARPTEWWRRYFAPLIASAAAAAVVAVVVTRVAAPESDSLPTPGAAPTPVAQPAPRPAPPPAAKVPMATHEGAAEWKPVASLHSGMADDGENEVVVDEVDDEGAGTILITVPAEEGGSTVIWLLEEEDSAAVAGEEPI